MEAKSSICSVPRRSSTRAFTLIELLASLAILALIMTMLFSIFEQVNKAWLNGEGRVDTFTQARAILDLMTRELSQAIATSKVPFFGKDPNDVYFVAPLNTDPNNQADLCEVGYEFNPVAFTLRRRFTASGGNIGGTWDFYTRPGAWWRTFDTSQDFFLANDNILNVQFVYLDRTLGSIPTPVVNQLPYAIQVSMYLVDNRTVTRLKLVPNVGTAWQSITNSTLRSFSTLVYMPNISP